MIRRLRITLPVAALAVVGGAPLMASEPLQDERASYSYVRTIDGRATLASAQRAAGEPVGLHEPLMQGDQVLVERGARLEIVLADRNLLRIGGGSALRLVRVAFSADRDDRTTRIDFDEGEILLEVTEDALGDELPEIRTPAGTVFIHQPGRYRLILDSSSALQITAREGYAELLTERGSTVIRSGEEAWTTVDRWGSVELAAAGPRGALERWADELESRTTRASRRELRVEPYLAYSAASLDDYGSWVYADAAWYWRPRVAVGWRPYWDGRWAWTPSGLTWVSNEPWGWVPYHYGSWAVLPGYGWVWQPGYRYSPAWVYWYVGPSWTGWCPVGYYTHQYRHYWRTGFRFGIYGWTGGSWGFYADWNFLPVHRVFDRDGRHWRRTGTHLGRTEAGEVPRGVLTTDTGNVPRDGWERPAEVVRTLTRRAGPRAGRDLDALAEVTDFVARRPNLPPSVERVVTREPGARDAVRRGSPLDPGVGATSPPGRRDDVAGWRRGTDASLPGRRGQPAGGPDEERLSGGFGRSPRWRAEAREPNAGESPAQFREGVRGRARSGGRGDQLSADAEAVPVPGSRSERGGTAGVERQGWRRQSGSGWPRTSPRTGAREEPVARVIDGVRRTQPSGRWSAAPPSGGVPTGRSPSSVERRASPPTGSVAPPTTPPAGRRNSAQAAPRNSSPSTSAPRERSSPPPRAAPSSPPPGRSSRSTGVSRSDRGSGDRSSASSSRGSSSGGGQSKASKSSGARRSQSSSSPPPRRGKPPHDGG